MIISDKTFSNFDNVVYDFVSTEYGKMWKTYLNNFHSVRAGITESILSESFSVDVSTKNAFTPYDWIAEAVISNYKNKDKVIQRVSNLNIADLGCGSFPMRNLTKLGNIIGIDISKQELDIAAKKGINSLILGDVSVVPLRSSSVDVVISTMALMLFDPLERVLFEINRILKPGGIGFILLPSSGPLSAGDLSKYSRLLLAAKLKRLDYPNDVAIQRISPILSSYNFEILSDEKLRFSFLVKNADLARTFIDSLYLPTVESENYEKLIKLSSKWIGKSLGIPLRRIYFIKKY